MPPLPYRTIAVSGNSMAPTYNDGDWLLFRTLSAPGAKKLTNLVGKVVVIERDNFPGILLIKRIARLEGIDMWVEGDNKAESTDSRNWGAINPSEIRGQVLLRYRKA